MQSKGSPQQQGCIFRETNGLGNGLPSESEGHEIGESPRNWILLPKDALVQLSKDAIVQLSKDALEIVELWNCTRMLLCNCT